MSRLKAVMPTLAVVFFTCLACAQQVNTMTDLFAPSNQVALNSSVTLRATVESASGISGGTVSFYDCGQLLDTVNVSTPSSQSQNLLAGSDYLSQQWAPGSGQVGQNTVSNVISKPNNVVNPAGTTGASLLQRNGTAYASAMLDLSGLNLQSGTYTFSFWMRTVTGVTAPIVWLDSGSGTRLDGNGDVSTGWVRYAVTYTGTPVFLKFGQITQDVYLWGLQLERNGSPGPYVSTSTPQSSSGGAVAATTVQFSGSGSHSLYAVYVPPTGSTYTKAMSGVLWQWVGSNSLIQLSSSASPLGTGAATLRITANVAQQLLAMDCASVTFSRTINDNTTNFAPVGVSTNGQAVLSLTPSTMGNATYYFVASCADSNGAVTAISAPLAQRVIQQMSAVVTAKTFASPSAMGAPLTLRAVVAPPANVSLTPTGTVTFYDTGGEIGQSDVIGGVATATISGLGLGMHSIAAAYSGDSFFYGAQASPIEEEIVKHQGCAPGCAHRRTITIPGDVSSDLLDFPFLFSGTYSYLANTADGLGVSSAKGYDILFTSDVEGQQVLDHEIESYDPATGAVNFWIRLPVLYSQSAAQPTKIYMWYGDPAITTSQENVPGVWQNGYVGVWHLGSNGSQNLVMDDSLGNDAGEGEGNPQSVPGKIGKALSLVSTANQYVDIGPSADLQLENGFTVSAWINPSLSQQGRSIVTNWWEAGSALCRSGYFLGISDQTANKLKFGSATNADCTFNVTNSATALANNTWSYAAGVHDGTSESVYLNGIKDGSNPWTKPASYSMANRFQIGALYAGALSQYFDGGVDEVRISSVARSADWIKAEYDNQSHPTAFYQIETAPTDIPAAWGYSLYRTITISTAQMAGLGTLTDFPVLVSSNSSDLATTFSTSSGRVQSPYGYDIIFTSDAAGLNRLDHEIESYSPNGGASFWVRIPQLTGGTTFYMWYGNPAVTTSQENRPGVWKNGYVGVWHMGTGQAISGEDSTGINDGTVFGTLTPVSGKIGGGIQDVTGPSYLVVDDDPSLEFAAGGITVSAWVNLNNTAYQKDLLADSNGSGLENYALGFSSTGALDFYYRDLASSTDVGYFASQATPDYGNWHFYALTHTFKNSSAPHMYRDSQSLAGSWVSGTGSETPYSDGGTLTIGGNGMDQRNWFNGSFDEVRISNVTRTAQWLKAEYINEAFPANFCTVGNAAMPAPGSGVSVTNIYPEFGVAGTAVTISGANFGNGTSTTSVTFNGVPGTINFLTSDQIVVSVPSGATTGPLVVSVTGVGASSPLTFTVSPTVTSVSPGYGLAGTAVRIQGTGFGASQGSGAVTLNGVPVTVTSWGASEIDITIPAGATTGPLEITINGFSVSAGIFRVDGKCSCVIAELRPPAIGNAPAWREEKCN